MKKLILILTLFYSFSCFALESIPHETIHSTPHENTNHESVHTTKSIYSEHTYTPIHTLNDEQIHTINTNNVIIYYTLLLNHHTNVMDTIKANTKEELKAKVVQCNDNCDTGCVLGILLFMIIFICIFIIIVNLI